MANKFLPFITEKSTPLHIYQTLLSRSKGMNTNTIISIFHLVLKEGIRILRKKVNEFDDKELSLELLYMELLHIHPEAVISDKEIEIFLGFIKFYQDEDKKSWIEELNEFSMPDILLFFLVLGKLNKLEEITDIPFNTIGSNEDNILSNLPQYIRFSDTGIKHYFDSSINLRCFIFYHVLLKNKTEESSELPPVCAIFTGANNDKS